MSGVEKELSCSRSGWFFVGFFCSQSFDSAVESYVVGGESLLSSSFFDIFSYSCTTLIVSICCCRFSVIEDVAYPKQTTGLLSIIKALSYSFFKFLKH